MTRSTFFALPKPVFRFCLYLFCAILSVLAASGQGLTINPDKPSLAAGQSVQFMASEPVTWIMDPPLGTLSADGHYTAPDSIISRGRGMVRIIARSKIDRNKSASTQVNLVAGLSVAISPKSLTVDAGKSVSFQAAIYDAVNPSLYWEVSPPVGSISQNGVYQAPASVASSTQVTVKVTASANNQSRSDTAVVTVTPVAAAPALPVSITVGPSPVNLRRGQSIAFAANVTGTTNMGVNWTLNPQVGSISPTGVYTAPSLLTLPQSVMVVATSHADPTKSATAIVNLQPDVTISLSPGAVSLQQGQSQAFSASVTGTTNTGVVWTLNPLVGSISASGVYTAPSVVTTGQSVTVWAISQADTTKSASATINLLPSVNVTVSPSSATLQPGQTQAFFASVTGTTNTGVTWSLNPVVGTISTSGLYTAPASISSSQSVTVTARSQADTTKMASAVINLQPPAQPVSVSVTPNSATLAQGQSRTFTASVSGTTNTAVTWSLNPAVGSITLGGVYTAPATVTASQTVTVTARSQADTTKSASAVVTLQPPPEPVTISVTPGTVSLQQGQSQAFVATVGGTNNTGVNWSVSPAVGSITTGGVYTAPATVTTAQSVTVVATSQADLNKFATAVVSLQPPAPQGNVTLSPLTASLEASQSVTVTAMVSGLSNSGVTWSLSPAGTGSLSTSGNTAVYVAPSSVTTPQNVEVIATSMADPTKFAKLLVALLPTVSVTVSPQTVSLTPGAMHKFTSTVTGSTNTAVTWSVNPVLGTIASDGTYQAPASITAATSVTVTAQSQADPTKKGTAQVNLQPDAATARVEFTVSADRLTSLKYGGVDFYLFEDYVVRGPVYQHPDGTVTTSGWARPSSKSKTSNPEGFIQVFNEGNSRQHTAKVEYTTPDNNTIVARACITNNDSVETLTGVDFALLSFKLPGPAKQYNQNIPILVNQYNGYPAGFLSGAWGSLAFWMGPYPNGANMGAGYSSDSQTQFDPIITLSAHFRGVTENRDQVLPGQTRCIQHFMRFGESAQTLASLAPDALQSFREQVPHIVNWPDRRPIAMWMTAEGTKRSQTNPRGYWMESALNAGNPEAFRLTMLSRLQIGLNAMNSMNPKPQGVIVWDLEGQEFDHAFTYVGHPDKLSAISPEMDAVADEFFATLRNAGYKVGVTIRNQTFGSGPTLPSGCIHHTNFYLTPKFVLTSAAFPYRSYWCKPGNTWEATSLGPGAQVSVESDEENYQLLKQKIGYARQRWGATIFYLDSNAYANGGPINHTIYRRLAQDFPDCLIFPELEGTYDWASTAPYNEVRMNMMVTPQSVKDIYPQAFSLLNVADADFASHKQTLINSVRSGDILLFRGWWNAEEIPMVQEIYAAAQR